MDGGKTLSAQNVLLTHQSSSSFVVMYWEAAMVHRKYNLVNLRWFTHELVPKMWMMNNSLSNRGPSSIDPRTNDVRVFLFSIEALLKLRWRMVSDLSLWCLQMAELITAMFLFSVLWHFLPTCIGSWLCEVPVSADGFIGNSQGEKTHVNSRCLRHSWAYLVNIFWQLHAAVGSSLGGMASLLSAALYPDRVER